MATPKAKRVVQEPVAAPVVGYVLKPRYREFVCDWFDLDEGEEPFKATIRTNLSFAEVNDLPPLQGSTYQAIWATLAPHVTAWNLLGTNVKTGALEAIPAPSLAGPEIFASTDPALTQWMFMTLKLAHQGGINGVIEQKKDLKTSEPSPSP